MTEEIKRRNPKDDSEVKTFTQHVLGEILKEHGYFYDVGEKIIYYGDNTSEKMHLIYTDPPFPRD